MTNMKTIKSWILLLAVLLLLSGCKRDTEEAGTRLVVALPQWFYPSAERPWLQDAWQSIRIENPEVEIDLQMIPGKTEQVLQKLLVVHASGQGPDLACIKMHWARPLVERGVLMPLEGCVKEAIWDARVPALRRPESMKGKPYMLPYDIGVRVLLYREDLFRAAGIREPRLGWTWDDFLHAAEKLTVDRDGDGTVDQWGFGVPAARSEKTIFQWLPWFWSLGGDFSTNKSSSPSLCTPEAAQAMQRYRDLAHKYRITPLSFYSMDQEAVFQGLAGGLFAMTEAGSWEQALLGKYSRFSDRIRIALLPDLKPNLPSVTLVDGWGFALLTKDPGKKQVIGRMLTRFSSSGHQLEKFEASRMLSPFQALYRDPRFLSDPSGEALAKAVSRARPLPSFASFPLLTEALEVAMQEILMKDADPGDVLAKQEKSVRRQLQRAQDPGIPVGRNRLPAAGASVPDKQGTYQDPSRIPPGSLRVRTPGDGKGRLLSPEELQRLKTKPVGDMHLVPLASLCPETHPILEIMVKAADGYGKRISTSRIPEAYLDPKSMYVVVASGGGRTFTVRDVVEMSVTGRKEDKDLVVLSNREPHIYAKTDLLSMAGKKGIIPFRDMLRQKGIQVPEDGTVLLIARDGYTRELAAESFLKGSLHMEAMRCAFPGLNTKDQVSDLQRIELQ